MIFNSLKPNRCRHCKLRMPADKARHVIHNECIEPWLVVQNEKKARKAAKDKRLAQVKERRETKAKIEAKKGRGYWLERAQIAFNRFIRLRDQSAGYACISSGRTLDWTGNKTDAGHFRSVGSAPHLRFDERNVHAQSKYENRFKAGNAPGYRIGLLIRYGVDFVEAVECDQTTRHYSIDEIKAIEQTYTAKAKALKAAA